MAIKSMFPPPARRIEKLFCTPAFLPVKCAVNDTHAKKRWWAEVCRLLWDAEPAKAHRIHFRSWVCLQRVLTGRPLAGLRPPLRHIRQTSKHRSQADHMLLFFFQVLRGCGPPALLTFHLGPPDGGSGLTKASSLLHRPSDGLENYD